MTENIQKTDTERSGNAEFLAPACSKTILAGKLCEHFGWSHDAIPEVEKMIKIVEDFTVRNMAKMTDNIVNNSKDIPEEYARLINENWEDLLY